MAIGVDVHWPLYVRECERSAKLTQVILLGSAEAYRANGEAPGVEGLDKLYPVRLH